MQFDVPATSCRSAQEYFPLSLYRSADAIVGLSSTLWSGYAVRLRQCLRAAPMHRCSET